MFSIKPQIVNTMFENLAGKKILITGGTGFIGTYVIKMLSLQGVVPTVLTRNKQTALTNKVVEKIDLFEIDLLDNTKLKGFFKKYCPEVIIHLAGVAHQRNDPVDILLKNNFEATVNLLESARAGNAERVVLTGTADEYGFQSCPQVETLPTMPVSDYAVSKNKAVKYAISLYEKFNFPVVVLRPFTIYGVGQPPRMFISQAVESAVKGIDFEMSEGIQKRDLLFVTDFASAIIKASTVKNIEGEIFNVGSGKAIALKELAGKIWEITNADKKLLKIGARPTPRSELHDTEADISKIRNLLNWEPKILIDEGLEVIVDKAKNNLR